MICGQVIVPLPMPVGITLKNISGFRSQEKIDTCVLIAAILLAIFDLLSYNLSVILCFLSNLMFSL